MSDRMTASVCFVQRFAAMALLCLLWLGTAIPAQAQKKGQDQAQTATQAASATSAAVQTEPASTGEAAHGVALLVNVLPTQSNPSLPIGCSPIVQRIICERC